MGLETSSGLRVPQLLPQGRPCHPSPGGPKYSWLLAREVWQAPSLWRLAPILCVGPLWAPCPQVLAQILLVAPLALLSTWVSTGPTDCPGMGSWLCPQGEASSFDLSEPEHLMTLLGSIYVLSVQS